MAAIGQALTRHQQERDKEAGKEISEATFDILSQLVLLALTDSHAVADFKTPVVLLEASSVFYKKEEDSLVFLYVRSQVGCAT